MKRFKGLKVSVLMLMIVLLASTLFVSCGGGSVSCSLEDISLSTDDSGEAVFMVEENDSSDEKAKRRQAISSVLNNVIKARPELLDMLETESSSDHFLQTLQTFADENYRKAVRMFPEMTWSEFYDYSAIGYAVANYDVELFETPYIEFWGSQDVKTFTPTFDQIMSCGFWTSYCLKRFDGLELAKPSKQPNEQNSNPTSLDSYITMRTAIMVQIAVKESLRTGDIPMGRVRTNPEIKILSRYMTNKISDSLKRYEVKRVSLDEDDYFSQIGNVSFYIGMLMKQFEVDHDIQLGHLVAASADYLRCFRDPKKRGEPHLTAAEGIANAICGKDNLDVRKWAAKPGNIPNWDKILLP